MRLPWVASGVEKVVPNADGMILPEASGDFREIAKPLAAWRYPQSRKRPFQFSNKSNNYSCLSAGGGSAGLGSLGISIGSGVAFGGGGVGAPLPQHESVPQQASPPLPVV
jgi:hypothetical protein